MSTTIAFAALYGVLSSEDQLLINRAVEVHTKLLTLLSTTPTAWIYPKRINVPASMGYYDPRATQSYIDVFEQRQDAFLGEQSEWTVWVEALTQFYREHRDSFDPVVLEELIEAKVSLVPAGKYVITYQGYFATDRALGSAIYKAETYALGTLVPAVEAYREYRDWVRDNLKIVLPEHLTTTWQAYLATL